MPLPYVRKLLSTMSLRVSFRILSNENLRSDLLYFQEKNKPEQKA